MGKPDKTTKSQPPFDRFQNFAKALVSVPRKELQTKLQERERQKKYKKRHATASS